MKNNKKLVMGLLALSICTLIGNTNIASADEIKPLNEVRSNSDLSDWVPGTVTADELNVRSGPGTNYTAIDSISYGERIAAKDYSNGYYYIRYAESDFQPVKYGWVSSDYIKLLW